MGHWHWRRSGLHLSLVPSHTDFPGDSNHLGHLMRESSRHQQWCRFLASGRLKLSLWLKLLLTLKELLRSAPPMLGCMSRDCRLMPRHVLQEPLSAPCICLALEDPMFTIAPFAIMKLETRVTYGGTVGSPTRLGGAVVVRYAASTMHARWGRCPLASLWTGVWHHCGSRSEGPRRHGGRRVGTGLNICSWNPECSHGGRNGRNMSELAWDQRVALAHACLQGAYLFIVEMVPRHDDRCAGAATSSYQRWIVPCAGKLHVACAILVPRSQSSISGCGLSPFLPAPGLVLLPQPALQTMLCMHPSSSCGLGHHSGEEQSLCSLKASQSISVSRGSHFQAHFVWQVLGGGQLSPAFTSMRLKSSWRVEIRPEYSKAPC